MAQTYLIITNALMYFTALQPSTPNTDPTEFAMSILFAREATSSDHGSNKNTAMWVAVETIN